MNAFLENRAMRLGFLSASGAVIYLVKDTGVRHANAADSEKMVS